MKNRFYILIIYLFINSIASAENIFIESENITLDKNKEISIFEKNVVVTTQDKKQIKSEYLNYNKKLGLLILKDNVVAVDDQNNSIETENAEYFENKKIFISNGPTKIITTEKYKIDGSDIIFDSINDFITSDKAAIITDQEDNKIYLENFEYLIKDNIFKSIGFIKIIDKNDNLYEFSQIYIDTKKKKILGTDTKAFMNHSDFKIDSKNKPRIFANTVELNKDKSTFNKSIFTLCDYRKNEKCPPWSIQASKMLHDNEKKTIYYDNAIIKVYDIPIFYLPKLSHPDPSVERRSGFLPPSFSDTKNLGSGISIPYFWAVNDDKNLTFTNKFYITENPLFLGEYHQAFKNSILLSDFGYTKGYKKESSKKRGGDKSHFFSKFVKNFTTTDGSTKSLSLSVQDVSDDKYLKLYKIDSNLVDYNSNILENTLNYTYENDQTFFGLNASIYESLKDDYNDKYEYIFPEVIVDKNLFSNDKFGSLDFQSNYKVHNYDTNKFTNFLVNDINWNSKNINFNSGVKGKILGNLKNINYETRNVDLYKNNTTNEAYGALGYLTEVNLQKKVSNSSHLFKPKLLVRYSPGTMRQEKSGSRLTPISAFSINRLDNINNYETGLSSTVGFDYKIKKNDRNFDFSVAQIINEKENKKMSEESSLNEKISDLTGSTVYKINNNVNLNYNFSLDQNYNEFNYNELGTSLDFNQFKIDFSYLEENKHIGDQEYFKTKLDYKRNENGIFSIETKRNLVTNSSEFYNLSYEYLNDCLRAGLVYRREFYQDSELEPENSLMFKITLTPFGKINAPAFNK